jgi:hypothetical protein
MSPKLVVDLLNPVVAALAMLLEVAANCELAA